MTFSNIALETPRSNGTSSSISEHFVDIVFLYSSALCNRETKELTFPSPPSTSVLARIPSRVFIVKPPPFFTVTCKFLVAVIRCRLTFQNRSLTWALTSFSFAISSSARNLPAKGKIYFRIMNESTTLGIRWHITRSRIFEAFNDCLFSA
jgi:hypothetical protein